jgi:hypothetical protein
MNKDIDKLLLVYGSIHYSLTHKEWDDKSQQTLRFLREQKRKVEEELKDYPEIILQKGQKYFYDLF